MRVSTTVVRVPWRAPLASAHDPGDSGASGGFAAPPRPLVRLRLEADDGAVGSGEAAPLESYDGVSVAAVLEALEPCEQVLANSGGATEDHPELRAACRALTALPQALAAVDVALWDLAGQRAGRPVWSLLGAAGPGSVAVNAVIGAVDPVAAGAAAEAAVRAGFGCVKVKVGVGDDRARVRAVRAAVGPGVAIRVDANGAWRTVEQAGVPVAVDESTGDPGVWRDRVADSVCLKIAAGGGISGVVADAARARALGYRVFLASTLDGPLGIAAALHVAAVLTPDRACGLSTLDRFAVPAAPFDVRDGRLAPPPGPGLGAGLAEWYAAAGHR